MRDTVNLEFVNNIKEVSEAIEELNLEIASANEKISLIESIDISKPVTEEQWHNICETPLRYSNLLAVLVKNTFPLAENILVHCNYVYFDMLGFKVQIPTSRCQGINVDTSWYRKDNGEPTKIYSDTIEDMIKYFNAVDNKLGWYECAKHRLTYGKTCKKWFLFIVWWFKYRWKDPKRKQFEEVKSQQEQAYKERVKNYRSHRKDIKNKTETLLNELLPLLNEFSTQHYNYNSAGGCYSIEQIKEFENL